MTRITAFFSLDVPLTIPGTNLDVRQRLALFFMYICCIMVGTALFYGRDQSTVWLDITASFITSLIGKLPQFVVRQMFVKSKPRKTDSYKARKRRSELPVMQKQISAFNMDRYQEVSAIRMKLYRKKYKLPSYCREIAWCCLIISSIIGCVTAILYGLSFDLTMVSTVNENHSNADLYASDCWDTSLQSRIENDLSTEHFNEAYAERKNMNASSGGSDAGSWLLSLGQSLLLSLILWQPLMTYIVTWIKVWMFTWNLKMQVLSICSTI